MSAKFGSFSAPATEAVAVTPSDTVDITGISAVRGLYVGVTGDVSVQMAQGPAATETVFTAVPAGAILPISITRVNATNTTATTMIALG